jgi:hypothetical protein
MEFSYVYILQIELKPLASPAHQNTLRRPRFSATKAVLPFSETPLAISPNRNAASGAEGVRHPPWPGRGMIWRGCFVV